MYSIVSIQAVQFVRGSSIVPDRCAILENRLYNCNVEMQELVGGNTRSLELFLHA